MNIKIFPSALTLYFSIFFALSQASALPTCKKSPVNLDKYLIFNPLSITLKKWHECIGKAYYEDGTFYEGVFLNGELDGFGIYYDAENKSTSKGMWKNGYAHDEHYVSLVSGEVKEGIFEYSVDEDRYYSTPQKTRFSPRESLTRDYFQSLDIREKKTIQKGLQKIGYYKLSIDGIYGPATQTALNKFNIEFLKRADLNYEHNVENLFVEIIMYDENYQSTDKQKSSEKQKNISAQKVYSYFVALPKSKRMRVQATLQRYGYFKGKIDGTWGKETSEGLKSYARDASLSSYLTTYRGSKIFLNTVIKADPYTVFKTPELKNNKYIKKSAKSKKSYGVPNKSPKDTYYSTRGTIYQRVGDTTYSSDGKIYQHIGNTTFSSTGKTYQHIGNSTFGSDGTSYQHIENTTFSSDGTICQTIGTMVICN